MNFSDVKPIKWVGQSLDGQPVDVDDEMKQYDVWVKSRQSFDYYSGDPKVKLMNFNFTGQNQKYKVRITEVVLNKDKGWYESLGEIVDEKMIEPIYEHWIELIEIETNKSYVYKLVDGVLLSPIDYEEEVKNTIEKHIY